MRNLLISATLATLALGALHANAAAQSAFTFQGQLKSDGSAFTGLADIECTLYDTADAGNIVAGPITLTGVEMNDGLFAVELDFGQAAFSGGARWVEIAVRAPSGGGGFSTLSPRQAVTAAPYASHSHSTRGLNVDANGNASIAGLLSPIGLQFGGFGPDSAYVGSAGNFIAFGHSGVSEDFIGYRDNTFFFKDSPGGGDTTLPNVVVGGNIGIGTDSLITPLTVVGPNDTNGTGWFASAKGPNNSHVHYGPTGDWYLRSADSAGKVVLQDSGGNVGIGTSNPAAKLHIAGAPGTDGIMFPDGTVQTTAAGAAPSGWGLSGNSGTNSGTHFIGTTDFAPLSFRVNNTRALRLEFGSNGVITGVNVVGGASGNSVASGVIGATVFGGTAFTGNSVNGQWGTVSGGLGCSVAAGADNAVVAGGQNNAANSAASTVGGGGANFATGFYSTISGGGSNLTGAIRATVGGGGFNNAGGANSTVSGGLQNTASGDTSTIGGGNQNGSGGLYSTVAGGSQNQSGAFAGAVGGGVQNRAGLFPNDEYATVAGGFSNVASWRATVSGGAGNGATGQYSTAAGGQGNTASNPYSTVSGGYLNVASGPYAVVTGGGGNTASGLRSIVLGGDLNSATGQNSLAAGHRALANHLGSFVWADSTDTDFASTANDQFVVRATGGVGINLNNPTTALHVNGTITGSVKNFLIDHPLDPANKTLRHASIESSELVNLYSGSITTDTAGRAIVVLPAWMEALNTDFRYQLTVAGDDDDTFVQAKIGREIENGQFVIRTSKPDVRVFWSITGVRKDAFALAHPLIAEEDKPEWQRGYFLSAQEHGQPVERDINRAVKPEVDTLPNVAEVSE